MLFRSVYGRLYLCISELAYSIAAMYRADLDWNYIVETSRVIGIYPGLGYYVSCVHAVHKRVMGTALPARPLDRDVPIVSGVRFGDLYYHLPSLGVASLYAKKLLTDFRVRNWMGIGRLTLIPFFIPLFWFKSWQRRAR